MKLPTLAFSLVFLAAVAPPLVRADVTLPKIISDGMVLQREMPILIFGAAPKGEKVTVSFRGTTASVEADGKWQVELPAQKPGGPFGLTIQGANKIELKDVYVGDVWVAGGQSNMALYEWEVKKGESDGKIRLFFGTPTPAARQHFLALPRSKVVWEKWDTSGVFSRVGWHFAKEIYAKEKVPIGIVHAAQGGTDVENWRVNAYPENNLFKAYVEPSLPFRIKGVIWWQGENNTWGKNTTEDGRFRYHKLFSEVITSWRKEWKQGDFPFLFVQLQTLRERGMVLEPENGAGWQLVRDGQRMTLDLPKTAMVVTVDVTKGDLHPCLHEEEVRVIAKRLAVAAQAVAYGKDVEWSGPLFRAAKRDGDNVVIEFTHVAKRLVAKGGELKDFEIKAADTDWAATKAGIAGETVVIAAKALKGPLRVRYGYRLWPLGNLFNGADLPASPFITEDIK